MNPKKDEFEEAFKDAKFTGIEEPKMEYELIIAEEPLLPGEPRIMPYQANPCNGDIHLCEEFLKLRGKFNIETVIELGSGVGGTTHWLCHNFKKVYSVEINDLFFSFTQKRIHGHRNVILIKGDTVEMLPGILCGEPDNILCWIDSHWLSNNPLLEELEIIAVSGLKPILAIHDMKVPNHPELGYDEYPAQNIVYEWSWIKPAVDKIYGENGYDYYYNSKATGAKRGCVFVTPK